jgi:small subunit ribosomal protein S17
MKRTLQGTVRSAKMDKSLRVDVQRLYAHPKYGKIVRGRTICYAHDEKNEAQEGDVVEIVESRPRSKMKRWELVRVIKRGGLITGEAAGEPQLPGRETEEAAENQ